MEKTETKAEYFLVQGWMVDTGLKGNDLLILAIINGFSRDNQGVFHGSLSYLQRSINASRPTVIKSLNNLCEMKLLNKVTVRNRGQEYNEYSVLREGSKETLPPVKDLNEGSKETLHGVVKKLKGGSKETLPNNKLNNKIDNKYNNMPILQIDRNIVNEFILGTERQYYNIAKMFIELFKNNLEKKGISTAKISGIKYKPEVTSIRLMMEKDEITSEQFRQIYDYLNSPAGDFWQTNILSCKKLREKAVTLLLQSKRTPNGKQQKTPEQSLNNVQEALKLKYGANYGNAQ